MTKSRTVFLLAAGIFLTGCANDFKSVQKEVDEMVEAKEAIIVSLNAINQHESDLQIDFDESLTADPELANFSDGSAPVFENIKSRQSELDKVSAHLEDLKENMTDLAAFTDEELPKDTIQTVVESATLIRGQLESYVPAYTEQLQNEKNTFEDFGAEDADFNTLYDGVAALNATSDGNLKALEPLVDFNAEFMLSVSLLSEELTVLEQ